MENFNNLGQLIKFQNENFNNKNFLNFKENQEWRSFSNQDFYGKIIAFTRALEKLGLKSAVLLALGYRDDENDWWSKLKKVRTPKERFIIPLT